MQNKSQQIKPHINALPKALEEKSNNFSTVNIYQDLEKDLEIDFECPIWLEQMKNPVIAPSGHTYEKEAIEEWIKINGSDPITREDLTVDQLTPNRVLQDVIKKMESHFVEQKTQSIHNNHIKNLSIGNIQIDTVQKISNTNNSIKQTLTRSPSFFRPEEKNQFFARAVEAFVKNLTTYIFDAQINVNNRLESACLFTKSTLEIIENSNKNDFNLSDELKSKNIPNKVVKFISEYYDEHSELDLAKRNLSNKANILKWLEQKDTHAISVEAGSSTGKKSKGTFSFLNFHK